MSKSLGDVLRWFRAVDGTTLGCVALSLPQVTALAAVLDAADYMKDRALEHDGDTDQHGPCAVCRGARYDYEQKRAALAEALEEGR